MIRIWKKEDNKIVQTDEADGFCWVDCRSARKDDLAALEKDYGIHPDHLQDIMDVDEQSRIEKDEEYTLIIMRMPVHDPRLEVAFYTVPVGIILFADKIVTVCQAQSDVLSDLSANRVKGLSLRNKGAFILQLFGRAALVYLRHLKEINRATATIERELQRSVKNNELVQLLSIQKSLVYFTTSLKSNEILLEKLQASRVLRFREEEAELLEDVLTDNKQAIEMSNIYQSILTGMMDAFASVISNNINLVMRRLTNISIILMVSTLVVSAFGMNLPNHIDGIPGMFLIVCFVAGAAGMVSSLFLRDRKPRKGRLAGPMGAGMIVGKGSEPKP